MAARAVSAGRFFVVMMCGPGEASIAIDTIGGILESHPHAEVWILDDATTDGTFGRVAAFADIEPRVVHQRRATSNGYLRICDSVFGLFAMLHARRTLTPADVVLKIDPDTLLIGRATTDAAAALLSRAGPGLVGAVRRGPAGRSREFRRQRRNMLLDQMLVGPAKVGGRIRWDRPYWVPALAAARANGYETGVSVQGGAIFLSGDTIASIAERGWFKVPADYTAMTFEEDIILCLLVRALGHALHELADAGDRWWVQHRPPLAEEEMLAIRPDLVHPLKDDETGWRIRRQLRALTASD